MAHENIAFFKNKTGRMVHIDEMGFYWDGSKNGVGKRKAAIYSNPLFPDPRQAASKSSKKVSILFGGTYEGVAIPPLILFPSTAKNSRMGCELLLTLKQIQGKFGYRDTKAFDCVIKFSENGSVYMRDYLMVKLNV